MAEGKSTYMGVGVGKYGNYEIQGTSDTTDTLTITGASSSASGDLLVVQNSTGTEYLVISSSGLATFAGAMAFSGSVAASAGIVSTVSSTAQRAGLMVSMTSTGAIAALATLCNGVVVAPSSKANINSVLMYDNVNTGGTDQVSSAVTLLGVNGTKAPTYFLSVSGSKNFGEGAGAAESNGFFSITHRFTSSITFSTLTPFATLAVMSGSYVFYVPCYPNTIVT